MGAKGSKDESGEALFSYDDVRKSGLSKAELAGCLASLSEMAQTGVNRSLPQLTVNGDPLPDVATPSKPQIPRQAIDVVRKKLRRMLNKKQSNMPGDAEIEHLKKQLELLDDMDSNEDNNDWAVMRDWLVWCMHENLDELSDDITEPDRHFHSSSRHRLQRQMSLDKPSPNRLLVNRGYNSLDGQSSSNQNSFDSTGTNGET